MALSFASLISQLTFMAIILGAFNPAIAFRESEQLIPSDYNCYLELNTAYKVHTERRTWSEAQQICIEEGAHLAMIDTMEKVRIIAGLKGINVYVWMGISRTDRSAAWTSAEDCNPVTKIPWAPGKPYGPHNCVAVRGCNRGLSNEKCSIALGFVCEMPLTTSVDIAPN